jgi:hypothetical protein
MVKLSLCLFKYKDMKTHGEVEVFLYALVISALDGCMRSYSRPGRINPWERTFNIHWTRGWVDPRSGLDAVGREDLLHLPANQGAIYDND